MISGIFLVPNSLLSSFYDNCLTIRLLGKTNLGNLVYAEAINLDIMPLSNLEVISIANEHNLKGFFIKDDKLYYPFSHKCIGRSNAKYTSRKKDLKCLMRQKFVKR